MSFKKIQQMVPAIHLVAGVSAEHGLEGYLVFERSVNSSTFLLLLLDEQGQNGKDSALLGDNASWHASHECFRTYTSR